MNIVDSSGWLEYFAEGENADFFCSRHKNLIVPTVTVNEVFKRILLVHGLDMAQLRIADLYKGQQVDLTTSLALSAARLSVEFHLPMANRFILVTALSYEAVFWTQDKHLRDIPGVKFIAKK